MTALAQKISSGLNSTKDLLLYYSTAAMTGVYDITIGSNFIRRLDAVKAAAFGHVQSYTQPLQQQIYHWGQRLISLVHSEYITNAHRALETLLALQDTASSEERNLAKWQVIIGLWNLFNKAPVSLNDQDKNGIPDLIVGLNGMDVERVSLENLKNYVRPIHAIVAEIFNRGFFAQCVEIFSHNMESQFQGLCATSA